MTRSRKAPSRTRAATPVILPRHIYVHVPFCARRCSYCDFAIAVRSTTPVVSFLEEIQSELAVRAPPRTNAQGKKRRWPIDTLYLGGGTPSRLGAAGVAGLIDLLRERCTLRRDAEVTLEANPDDVTPSVARAWRAAGINRISLGAQSFDNKVLDWMHRTHTAAQTVDAVQHLRQAGIENVSLDLIFALPEELGRDWERDLHLAIAMKPSHLSLYGLTVEPHTPLSRWVRREVVREAPEERHEVEFLQADAVAHAAGFEHYEVSNFARPGCRSRHNSAYWRGVPYLGLGPAAHGYDGVTRRWNTAAYAQWRRIVLADNDPVAGSEVLTETNRETERFYLQLRTAEGTVLSPEALRATVAWVRSGWAVTVGDRLRLTPYGWLRMDALVTSLTQLGSRYYI